MARATLVAALLCGAHLAAGYKNLYLQAMRQHGQEAIWRANSAHRASRKLQDDGGGSSCPLQDLEEMVPVYSGGGYSTCQEVVSAGQCASTALLFTLCPVACGLCNTEAPPDLSIFCHCFTTGWSMNTFSPGECWQSASTVLMYAKDQCGAGWYRDINTLPNNVNDWDGGHTLSWALHAGEYFGIEGNHFFQSFLSGHPIFGEFMPSLTVDELQTMGFTVGETQQILKGVRGYFFASYHPPPLDSYAVWDPPEWKDWEMDPINGYVRERVEQRPIEVSTSVVLEALIGIDEVGFCFEVQFLLVVSWQDERINTRCNGAGANGNPIPASDRCKQYWTPDLPPVFPNQVSIDGNPPIEVLEDLGLFTQPGKHRIDCKAVGAAPVGEFCDSVVNTSVAYRMMRLRGSFGAAFAFQRFPFDRQELELIIRSPANMPRSQYKLVPKAKVDPAVLEAQKKSINKEPDAKDVIGGWRVLRMSTQERGLLSNTTTWDADGFATSGDASAKDDPLFAMMDEMSAVGQAADAEIPYYSQALSEASYVVYVCRIPTSYMYNFLVLVSLLYFIALVSYLLFPGDLDPRVNLALTVFLGVIFFQIMLSDLLPTTGYLTDMHLFTFLSTMLVVVVALSHVVIYGIYTRGEKKRTLLQKMRLLQKSRRLLPAVIMVQRRVRVFLARKYLQRRIVDTDRRKVHPADGAGTSTEQVESLAVARKQEEARATQAAATLAVARLVTMGRKEKLPFARRVTVIVKWANLQFELFCVHMLVHVNWLVAFAISVGYVLMLLFVFQGANWIDKSQPDTCN